jgi:hypothetical protein
MLGYGIVLRGESHIVLSDISNMMPIKRYIFTIRTSTTSCQKDACTRVIYLLESLST